VLISLALTPTCLRQLQWLLLLLLLLLRRQVVGSARAMRTAGRRLRVHS
jgi:hypothetical protein